MFYFLLNTILETSISNQFYYKIMRELTITIHVYSCIVQGNGYFNFSFLEIIMAKTVDNSIIYWKQPFLHRIVHISSQWQ